MKKKQAFIERIDPSFGSSFTLKKFDSRVEDHKPFWHFHQEIELVYIPEGNGKRHIGNHISNYYNGDLLVIGGKLPHFGFRDRLIGNGKEVVLHFREDFLGENILMKPEFIAIRRFLELSKNGISFFGNSKSEVGERLESLFYMSNFEKLIEVMKILNILATSRDMEVLNVSGVMVSPSAHGADRLDEVFSFVRENFQEEIALEQLAEMTSMMVPSFCRFFKKQTGKTFIEFLNEYRIAHACKLLADDPMSITDVCFEAGFNNFSHFNKYFKRITGKSPSEYRKELALVVLPE